MINAGVSIKAYDGTQAFDPVSEEWQHIKVTINYPEGQDVTNNPPLAGDVLVSTSGVVWLVVLVNGQEGGVNDFSLNLQSTNKPPSEDVSPALGQVSRAALITPVKGMLVPYWSSQVVADEVARLAALYSSTINERDNTADLDKPVSTTVQTALDAKADKVEGKGLSTEDYTSAEKTKLGGVEDGAQVNVARLEIRCDAWSMDTFVKPADVTLTKEYDGSSLRITHGRGLLPSGWFLVNREANPMTSVLPTSLRNVQVISTNEIIVTSLSSFEQFDLVITFA